MWAIEHSVNSHGGNAGKTVFSIRNVMKNMKLGLLDESSYPTRLQGMAGCFSGGIFVNMLSLLECGLRIVDQGRCDWRKAERNSSKLEGFGRYSS